MPHSKENKPTRVVSARVDDRRLAEIATAFHKGMIPCKTFSDLIGTSIYYFADYLKSSGHVKEITSFHEAIETLERFGYDVNQRKNKGKKLRDALAIETNVMSRIETRLRTEGEYETQEDLARNVVKELTDSEKPPIIRANRAEEQTEQERQALSNPTLAPVEGSDPEDSK